MLYQKLMMKAAPYHVGVSTSGVTFQDHRHPEFEFNYCMSGSGYRILMKGEPHEMKEGCLAVVGPMVSHEYQRDEGADAKSLTVTLGAVFLNEYHEHFSAALTKNTVFDLSGEKYSELRELFRETSECFQKGGDHSELMIRGNLYKICAYMMKLFSESERITNDGTSLINVSKIEKAVELIRNNYKDKITVSETAMLCGYSESNFCKHFKNVTGQSFHSALNKRRVENACILLKNTAMSLDDIAVEVGFADSKSLCRVFKNEMGVTPTEYRKGA